MKCISYLSPRRTCYHQIFRHLAHHLGKICIKHIKKVLQDSKKSDTILIVVGPEGGFSNCEVDYLINNGFIRTTLGNNILRAETVPLFILSVINYEFLR